MKKQILTILLCLILTTVISTGSSLAYLTANENEANVLASGNVSAQIIESERVSQTNSGEDALRPFVQQKNVLPAVGEIRWATDEDGRVYQKWGSGGSSVLFDAELKNVVDKFVFVQNTGSDAAYLRVWFAFEAGDLTAEEINNKMLHWNRNVTHWEWTDFSDSMKITVEGVEYFLRVATYVGSDTVHTGGILPGGATTRPSLLQFFFDSSIRNDDIMPFGDEYKILAFAQLCQVEANTTPQTCLCTYFGDVNVNNNPWRP